MKNFANLRASGALALASIILLSSCASTTIIQSVPTAAKIYVDGEPKGTTPYRHTDTKIVGSTTHVRLVQEGYEPFNASFTRNEELDTGALIGGILVYVPLLWVMGYKPMHTYELVPKNEETLLPEQLAKPPSDQVRSKAERLREMKKLLDDNVLTPTEYEREKKKILEEK